MQGDTRAPDKFVGKTPYVVFILTVGAGPRDIVSPANATFMMTTDTDTAGFQARLDAIRGKIDRIQTEVTEGVTQTIAAVSLQLQDGLGTLGKLAAVISGDFDSRPRDIEPRPETALLKDLTAQCDAVHDLAVKAMTKVGDDHAKARLVGDAANDAYHC
jgi:hypothetical protein